jgi:hypothetical protein
MNSLVGEINIVPLQTQALRNPKARASSQQREGTFGLWATFGSEN